jgi:hypothetical protein
MILCLLWHSQNSTMLQAKPRYILYKYPGFMAAVQMRGIFWVLHLIIKRSDSFGESTGWIRSRCSVVEIATRLRAERSCFQILGRIRDFSCLKCPDWLWGQPSLYQMGTRSSVCGDKAGYSLASSAGVKKMWNFTSIPPVCIPSWHGQGQLYLFVLTDLVQHPPETVQLPCRWGSTALQIVRTYNCCTV